MKYFMARSSLLFFILISSIVFLHADDKKAEFMRSNFPDHRIITVESEKIYELHRDDKIARVYFSDGFSNAVGYAGIIKLMILVQDEIIEDILVYYHIETPYFMNLVIERGFLEQFNGKKLEDILKLEVDTITTATFTSYGIIEQVMATVSYILNVERKKVRNPLEMTYVLAFMMLIILSLFLKKPIFRTAIFILYFILFLFYFRSLISMDYIIRILKIPFIINVLSIFTIFIIVISIFKYRYYCFNLCPVGFITQVCLRTKWKKFIIKENILIRILLFLIILIVFFLGSDLLMIFPFKAFVLPYNIFKLGIIFSFIVISLFSPNFWCNTACPLGTFFILINYLKREAKKLKK